MKRPLILTVVFVLLVALIGGFTYFQFVVKPEMVKGFIAAGGQAPITVEAEIAKSERWQPRLPAIGTLRAIQGVDIASEVGGIVREINFDSGHLVTEGTVLVKLDDTVEQADLRSGEAQLRLSDLDFRRQEELLRRKNTSQTAYDTAKATRDTAAAVVARVKAVIEQKSIKAAFGGRLGIRNVDLGQYVSPGDSMVTLQRLSPIYVDFPVPEQELDKLSIGVKIEVTVDSEPNMRFEGEVESIDAKVNQATRNVLVRARMENRNARLLPGMFADIDVLAGDPQPVVTLPRTAVTFSLYGDSIYVVVEAPPGKAAGQAEKAADKTKKNLIVKRRFVRVGETRGDRVSILEGVKAGEQVVVAGQIKLRPEAHVVVDNSDPLKPPAKRPLE